MLTVTPITSARAGRNVDSSAPVADVVEFDAALINKLGQSGPRYTSYPSADRFSSDFGYGHFLEAQDALRQHGQRRPLSLYLHIPFCDTVCYYCACNKVVTKVVAEVATEVVAEVVTKDRSKAATYLRYLKQETAIQGKLFAGMNQIAQLHVGEYSIEIDPRTVARERVLALRAQGFNRISLGVQDFDADVQRAVNRIQPESATLTLIAAPRVAGFRSVSIDLIYALPKQTMVKMVTMAQTLAKVVSANPDRIALHHYAHLPHQFKPQRRILDADMPASALKLDLLALSIAHLTQAGYVYIGMDHFARPDDDLAIAQPPHPLRYSKTIQMSAAAAAYAAASSARCRRHPKHQANRPRSRLRRSA